MTYSMKYLLLKKLFNYVALSEKFHCSKVASIDERSLNFGLAQLAQLTFRGSARSQLAWLRQSKITMMLMSEKARIYIWFYIIGTRLCIFIGNSPPLPSQFFQTIIFDDHSFNEHLSSFCSNQIIQCRHQCVILQFLHILFKFIPVLSGVIQC